METKYLLALNAHPKIGSQTIKKALAGFGDDVERLWRAQQSQIKKRLEPKIATLIIEAREKFEPDDEAEKLKKINVGYITQFDKEYPKLLLELHDAPAVLYIRGNAEALRGPNLSIVGSRKYSHYGRSITTKLAQQLASQGVTIVSGLALGIDAWAHQAALTAGGLTVGILACGLDQIYPASNRNLAQNIILNKGAILSENPPGTPPLRQNFPARNRIIAGLTQGTLVIEAAEKSGALITAYSALEYNREVMAVPGPVDAEGSKGTNKLIQLGAKLITCVDDILSELNIETKKSQEEVSQLVPESEDERIINKILGNEELLVDVIIENSKMNVVQVSSILTIMEMKGMVENVGGRWKRKG